jgi:UDP-glucose 4-epimerase
MKHGGHVVVTGGAGFIGSHLTETLLSAGETVVVIDDFSTGSWGNLSGIRTSSRLRIIEAQVGKCENLDGLIREAKFVFHLAAAVGVELVLGDPLRAIHTNLHETESVLNAASKAQVPTMLTSTSEVYGKSNNPVLSEGDDLIIGPPHFSRWSYACSKLMDEFLAMAHRQMKGLPVTIARLFNTVGPRQSGNYGMVLPRFVAAALAGDPLRVHGDGSQTRCFCHVGDTVEALLALARSEGARGEIFNVGRPDEITILDLARLVIETLGSNSSIQMVPYSQAYSSGFAEMHRRRPDIRKLEASVGFRPKRDLVQTIRDVVAWAG